MKVKDLGQIMQRISDAKMWRKANYEEDWKEWLRQYMAFFELREGRSNLFIPLTFMLVETVKARTVESLFANRPYVRIMGRSDEDEEKARKNQPLLDWQLQERINIRKVASEGLVQDAIICGTAITYTGWERRERAITKRVPTPTALLDDNGEPMLDDDGNPQMTSIMKPRQIMEVEYDDPVVRRIDLLDFFVDPMAIDIPDARYCGHEEFLTREQIELMEEKVGWKVNWKKLAPTEETTNALRIRTEAEDGAISFDSTYTDKDKGGRYKVCHYWEDNRHVVIVNDAEAVLDEENPFWHGMKPYDKTCYTTLSGRFYGMGLPQIIQYLQAELNTARNMRTEYHSMAIRRMFKVLETSGLTPSDLVWEQGGVLVVKDMDDLQEINVQPLPASAFAIEETAKEDAKAVTGVYDIILGTSKPDETATTTMTKDNNASIRFKDFIHAFVENILTPVAKKCMILDTQFLSEFRKIRVIGESIEASNELMEVNPDDLNFEYDLYYVGSAVEPLANKESMRQKFLEVYAMAMQHPQVQVNPELQLALLKALMVIEDARELANLLPDQPIIPMMPGQPTLPGQGGDPTEGMTYLGKVIPR
jgi:hypothetical protein